ncbi:uncharacterized protein BXZ73DRAFT_97625 [Epithele typhae]|uniref:uncharacterized protein n=1 Tax=Epithele typhae TaxID=378194 RepID=UPI0020076D16|nr:uncharacterized protein BXZ73DRAFT_97625 [Epithele typhae]KAH9942205.1 hypothetical protein BXZ73DRAFT_97625 [Epithele typhae]
MSFLGDDSDDSAVLSPVLGSGVPTQIATGNFCVTANGLLWTLNVDEPTTISNADGNCWALGRPAVTVPVVLDRCLGDVLDQEQWNPIVAA